MSMFYKMRIAWFNNVALSDFDACRMLKAVHLHPAAAPKVFIR